jgi:hypothetical protein
MALLDAAMNVFTANLPLATLMLNILHGNVLDFLQTVSRF